MPEVISDTSPIQYLHQAGLLDLLPAFYAKLIIPSGVVEELETGRQRGVSLPDVRTLSWVEIREVKSHRLLRLSPDLGLGEKQAIALALESAGSLVLLDDALARRQAELLEIRCTGTLGVLLKAKRLQILPAIAPVTARLIELGFHLSGRTREAVLRLSGEST
jgi:predicted nucleic acid-binding protein